MFLVFEGADGVGKSTQIGLLAEHLRRTDAREVLVVQEPGGTRLGESVRDLLLNSKHEKLGPATELFLFMAARSHLVSTRIRPALDGGAIVLCDRFLWSSVVYQGIVGGLGEEEVLRQAELAVGEVRPTRTFMLHVDEDEVERRRRERRSADRFENRDVSFHRRVREAFLQIARRHADAIDLVDAGGVPEAVHRRILDALSAMDGRTAGEATEAET